MGFFAKFFKRKKQVIAEHVEFDGNNFEEFFKRYKRATFKIMDESGYVMHCSLLKTEYAGGNFRVVFASRNDGKFSFSASSVNGRYVLAAVDDMLVAGCFFSEVK